MKRTLKQEKRFIVLIIVFIKVFVESRNRSQPEFDFITQKQLDDIAKGAKFKHYRRFSRQAVKMLLMSGIIQPFKGKVSSFHPKFKALHSDFEFGYTLCRGNSKIAKMEKAKEQKELDNIANQIADTGDTARDDWGDELADLIEQRRKRLQKDDLNSYLSSLTLEELYMWIVEQKGTVLSQKGIGSDYAYETYRVGDHIAKVFYEKEGVGIGMWMIVITHAKFPEPIIRFNKE